MNEDFLGAFIRMERTQVAGHIRSLDGARGLAVLMVFFYHSLGQYLLPSSMLAVALKNLLMTGWAGVDLFFVLSGFLITKILLDARAADNYYRVFYLRRVLRIVPLYYLVVACAFLLATHRYSGKVQIFYWLNLSNWPTGVGLAVVPSLLQMWSLAIEEQFYLLWPSLVRRLRVTTLAKLCVGTIGALLVIRNLPPVLLLNARWPELIYHLTPFRIDTLCGGALLAVIVHAWPDMLPSRACLRALTLAGGAIFLVTAYGRLSSAEAVVRVGYTALVVAFVSLMGLALRPEGWSHRILNNAGLRQMGKYSYCFYLVHIYPVFYFDGKSAVIHRVLLQSTHRDFSWNVLALIECGVAFAMSLAVCWTSWTFVEGPLLRLKRYFRYSPRRSHLLA